MSNYCEPAEGLAVSDGPSHGIESLASAHHSPAAKTAGSSPKEMRPHTRFRNGAMGAGATRKRAPKVYAIPAEVAPGDTRGRLKQLGHRTASGVKYLSAFVREAPLGDCGDIAIPTIAPAHEIVRTLQRCLKREVEGDFFIWLSLDGLRLCARRLQPDEQRPLASSCFGLERLACCGDSLVVPRSTFPARKSEALCRQAIYLDNVLSRASSLVRIEVEEDPQDGSFVVIRTHP